jgi:hypothetical protein
MSGNISGRSNNSESNPFDLTNTPRSNGSNSNRSDNKSRDKSPMRPRLSSNEDKNEKVKGLIEIPREFWKDIKYATFIKYINMDNELKCGIVLKNPTSFHPQSDQSVEVIGFVLQNNFNKSMKNHFEWHISYDSIECIYIKPDATLKTVIQTLESTVSNININMKRITDYIKKIDERIKKIEQKNNIV